MQTAQVGGTSVVFAGSDKVKKIDYPGGIAIIEGVVTAKKDTDNNDSETYKFDYALTLTGGAGTIKNVKWTLYEKTDGAATIDASACKFVSDDSVSGSTHYYYNITGEKSETIGDEDCNYANLRLSLGSQVATGTMEASSFGSQAENITGTIEGVTDQTGLSKHYYLVLEYPNTEEPQTGDMGQAITATLSMDTSKVTAKITSKGN